MNVAFYSPLKPPTSPVPSGDRRVARLLVAALEQAGHQVELASIFRSREPAGDAARQQRLAEVGARLAERLIRRYKAAGGQNRPDVWFTYHLYYKAPDWIGPIVARELDIPYVAAEASFAPKRAGGPWDVGHRAAGAAIAGARLIFGLNTVNATCVMPLLGPGARYVPLKPFLEATPDFAETRETVRRGLSRALDMDENCVWLLAVAMMRDDAKLQSYRLLAEALRKLPNGGWRLLIVGGGPAEAGVRALFSGIDAVFTGQKTPGELDQYYRAADIFVWPAIEEAYGMAILEAAARGLPVVAGDAGGVGDIVRHGETGLLAETGDAREFADAVQNLLDDPGLRAKMGAAARRVTSAEHGLDAAARLLDLELRRVVA
ncbi:MAG: glycosyltransferase family 4 protein [Rhodospirillales bacterium]|nr:glycosyltransferase family 4 protein [Rhodospirillales bacterium]